MKLELKHVSGYLPYGLKVHCRSFGEGEIITINGYYITKNNDVNLNFIEKYGGSSIIDCKPILHPLSDLAKEIEVNRKKFVPKEKLWDEIVYDTDEEYYRILKREWDEIDLIKSAPYRFVQRLQEWHFDIYGLIENGLAIDINTL